MIDATDRRIIAATQAGLPIVEQPYHAVAAELGLEPDDVIRRMERMMKAGVIRRIGVVPNHYKLGLTANGMSVWDIDDAQAVELGEKVGTLDFVSHCYLRPRRLPIWRYNLFAMVHGQSRDEVVDKARTIEELLSSTCRGHDILYSTRILKKTGLRIAA